MTAVGWAVVGPMPGPLWGHLERSLEVKSFIAREL